MCFPIELFCVMLQADVLLAYQVALDLFENEMQSFLLKVGLPPTLILAADNQHNLCG